jgi:glutamine phosphoribosylpyrophosphate amidotransferase
MMAAIGDTTGYCNACFTGRYPLSLPPAYVKSNFEARKIEDD